MNSSIVPVLALVASVILMLPSSVQGEGEETYRLKANDQIRLSVYREADLSTEVHLTQSGEASFPLINAVHLGGLTLREAEEELTRLYDAKYLVEPKLSLNLLEAAKQHVSVVGAVIKPGEVPLPKTSQLDLLGALASAGGLSQVADRRRIELSRGEGRSFHDLDQLQAKGAKAVVLRAGDRITVAVSRFAGQTVMVVGEVAKPGAVPFPLSGHLDLATLVEAAGGVSEKGDPARIRVTRGKQRFGADLASSGRHPIAPGDLVSVPPSVFAGKTVTVMGKVQRPGAVPFPFDGKLTALEAVARAGGFSDLGNRKKVDLTRNGKRTTLNLKEVAEGKRARVKLLPGDTLFVQVRVF